MPKDKTATNARIIKYMKEEFLAYGYEKASLNRISEKVGITTAGLYKHFKSKEDMFHYLVNDTLEAFRKIIDSSAEYMSGDSLYNPFDEDWSSFWVNFIYDHYDGIKLLVCCSKGSSYENFEEKLIDQEAAADKEYAKILKDQGYTTKTITDQQWHMLATAYVHLIFEIVRHDMTRLEAGIHMKFVGQLLYPGWKELFGFKNE